MKMLAGLGVIVVAAWLFVRIARKQRAGAELDRLRAYREAAQ